MRVSLESKALGILLATAVGDALGSPYEGKPRSFFGPQLDLSDYGARPGCPAGQYSDDTQMTLAIAESLAARGRVDGEDIARRFVRLWESGEIIGGGASCTDAVMRMMREHVPWHEAGTEIGRAGNGTAMRVSPIGWWDYDSVDRIREDARVSSIITHKDPRATAGAIGIARAVAFLVVTDCVKGEDLLETVSDAMREFHEEFAHYVRKLGDWLQLPRERAVRLVERAGWEPEADPGGITAFVIPTVLMSLYSFLCYRHDFLASVQTAIRAGGDVDTTAAITGALHGAHNGFQLIPAHLVASVKDRRGLGRIASALYEAKTGRRPTLICKDELLAGLRPKE